MHIENAGDHNSNVWENFFLTVFNYRAVGLWTRENIKPKLIKMQHYFYYEHSANKDNSDVFLLAHFSTDYIALDFMTK